MTQQEKEIAAFGLETAKKNLARQWTRSMREGDGWFVEADVALNNASRGVIKAVVANHGMAYIYAITNTHVPAEYNGNAPLYNFCGTFVMGARDTEVERLIRERREAVYTNTTDDAARIDAIFDVALARGALLLHWS